MRCSFLLLVTLLGLALPLAAINFWLVPLGSNVTPGETLTVLGQTSSAFPCSLSATVRGPRGRRSSQ